MKRILTALILMLTAFGAYAADQAGVISGYEGRVSIFEGDSPRGANVTEDKTPLFFMNKIATKKNSSAIIDLVSGDRVALLENAVMTIQGKEEYIPWDGKVIFSINKRGQASGVKVALTSAVIGVKGTMFLIDADKSTGKYDIFLEEGVVECKPVEGQFKMYKEVQMNEFDAYIKQMTGEYDAYVKKLQEEYVEFVDSFVMKPGDAFSVTGQEVRKVEFTEDIRNLFKLVE